MRSSAIQATDDDATATGTRTFTMPLDPLLTLAALGLAIASVVTLGPATQNVIAGQPDYYVHRQVRLPDRRWPADARCSRASTTGACDG